MPVRVAVSERVQPPPPTQPPLFSSEIFPHMRERETAKKGDVECVLSIDSPFFNRFFYTRLGALDVSPPPPLALLLLYLLVCVPPVSTLIVVFFNFILIE